MVKSNANLWNHRMCLETCYFTKKIALHASVNSLFPTPGSGWTFLADQMFLPPGSLLQTFFLQSPLIWVPQTTRKILLSQLKLIVCVGLLVDYRKAISMVENTSFRGKKVVLQVPATLLILLRLKLLIHKMRTTQPKRVKADKYVPVIRHKERLR